MAVVCAVQALVVLEYLIKAGSERVQQQCKENLFSIQTLKDFQYLDKDGKDQGVNSKPAWWVWSIGCGQYECGGCGQYECGGCGQCEKGGCE